MPTLYVGGKLQGPPKQSWSPKLPVRPTITHAKTEIIWGLEYGTLERNEILGQTKQLLGYHSLSHPKAYITG